MVFVAVGFYAIQSFRQWTRSNELILQELRMSNRPFFHAKEAVNHVAMFIAADPDPK